MQQTKRTLEGQRLRDGNAGTTRCRNCGAYATSQFAKVFGDNDDEIHRCIECSTLRNLQQGAATQN
jgi:hypothetical protein